LRQNQTNTVYQDFISFFLSAVTGKRLYYRKYHSEPISQFITPSDEAFGLLMFENSYYRWYFVVKSGLTHRALAAGFWPE
jgi:hypothetical protein